MHLLVLRFSAIGDVALTVPVLQALQEKHPELRITVVSRGFLKPLFQPLKLNFIAADLKGRHKGVAGLRRLYDEVMQKGKPDAVIDLHGVLRSFVLGGFFRLRGIPVYRIDKGRVAKRALSRRENKVRQPLPHSCERYAAVFEQAGFPLDFDIRQRPRLNYHSPEAEKLWQALNYSAPAIGIAPLASFPAKAWPLSKMEALIKRLRNNGHPLLLFGGREDLPHLERLKNKDPQIELVAGRFNFAGEIALMAKLSAMVAMDSGNMHLASLAGIPVVSIWGGTHHYAGFGPLGDNLAYIAEVDPAELPCRPCSVFGKEPCFRHDYACLHRLEEELVLKRITAALHAGKQL